MPSFPLLTTGVARRLSRHLDRLHDTLEGLGDRLREAVSEAVGRAVADAVQEAVESLLDVQPGPPSRPSYRSPAHDNHPTMWGSSPTSSWPYEREDREYSADRPLHHYQDERLEDEDFPPDPPQPARSRPRRWGVALAAGLKAAAWWLGRWPGKSSVLAAATVGVATGVAALFGSPLAATLVGMAGSALALLSVADTVRSGATVLAPERR
jgi:hypothetical protein